MISFYRKYRPQKVSELDLTKVREFFERILKSGKFSHAYLFTGPKGTGKTSAARILAKILNCQSNSKSRSKGLKEPCGKCSSCTTVKSGTSLAVIEMDAASNRGIDDIRSLREKIGLAPVQGSYTVYIVDEVHMLTTEAFNALLKTLEEPPEHAVFILCTTEPAKLPETIISRCTRINFNKAAPAEVERSLKKVIKGEGLNIETEAVKLLASEVDGSFRDGMKILEQLAQLGKKIRVTQMQEELGRSKGSEPEALLNLMLKGEVEAAVAELDRLSKQGTDWQRLIRAMLSNLRVMIRAKVGIGDKEAGSELLAEVSLVELEWLVGLLIEAGMQMKSAAVVELPIEIAVIEFCLARQNQTQSSKLKTQSYNEKVETNKKNDKQENEKTTKKQKTKGNVSLQIIKEKWAELLASIKPHNHSLEALLRATRPIKCEGERLILEVFYKFHKERLEQDRYREIIEAEVGQMFSWPVVKLQYQLASRRPEPKLTKHENVTAKVEDEEIIKAAEEIFGTE